MSGMRTSSRTRSGDSVWGRRRPVPGRSFDDLISPLFAFLAKRPAHEALVIYNVNAVLAAADYNFHLLLRWLELLLSRFLAAQKAAAALQWV